MLENGEIHNQQIKAFQFNKMLDMFKNPLLFAWEQFKYGWHSDFWKEGDSMIEYDMFLFNSQEHLDKCLLILDMQSPFTNFERNGQITCDLKEILSDISKRISSVEFKVF